MSVYVDSEKSVFSQLLNKLGVGTCFMLQAGLPALGPGWSSTSLLQSSAQQYRQCKNNPFFINKGLLLVLLCFHKHDAEMAH